MRTIALYFVLLPLLLVGQAGPETDEHAIREVMDRFMDAWNRHDAKAFAAVFSEDADFTNWRGTGASGRAKIEAFHAPMFATIFSKSHLEYRYPIALHPSRSCRGRRTVEDDGGYRPSG